jgi:hypothetical protein
MTIAVTYKYLTRIKMSSSEKHFSIFCHSLLENIFFVKLKPVAVAQQWYHRKVKGLSPSKLYDNE